MASTTKNAPRIKNYTSITPVDASLTLIRRALAAHKASLVIFEGSDGEGNPTGVAFLIEIKGQPFSFRLPVRVEHVKDLVSEAHAAMGKPLRGEALLRQASRTAWCNIKDWVLAQMALIDGGGPKIEEVFFPYMVDDANGQTVFEAFERQLALPTPKNGARAAYTIQQEG